mgnify:CR=1 FL=1
MSNMSYCRFENTYNNLRDYYKIMANEIISDELLSISEEKYK